MPGFEELFVEVVIRLLPMLFDVIRWEKDIGRPSGNLCSSLRIRVQELIPSQFREFRGGTYCKTHGAVTFIEGVSLRWSGFSAQAPLITSEAGYRP